MISRRQFLKRAGLAGIGAMMPINLSRSWAATPVSPGGTGLRKFIQPLPGLGATGMPVATPDTTTFPGCDYYKIRMGEFTQQLHPDLPATKLWGYADVTFGQAPNHRYLGGGIVAKKGRPVRITAINNLPATHPLPVDTSANFPFAANNGHNRAAIHLHGGFTPWNSDGGPDHWFDPNGNYGMGINNMGSILSVPDMGTAAAGTFNYYFTNDQSSRLMFYHDHARDITRLNVYAGLAAPYILRDDFENYLIRSRIIPSKEIPLVLQDKTFNDGLDTGYTWGKVGDLWYPYIYDGLVGPNPVNPVLPVPSANPEFFADTITVNGAVYPYVNVEPRHYRFRILNAANSRFFNLQLYYAQSGNINDPLSGEANLAAAGPRFVQIGNEGGFLPAPVLLNNPPVPIAFGPNGNAIAYNLLVAPAERADVIIDFSKVPVGSVLILYNDASAPFPMGNPLVDFFTGNTTPGAPATAPGFGPNSRTLMQFRVVPRVGLADPPTLNYLEEQALANPGASSIFPAVVPLNKTSAVRTRNLTLNEGFDSYGRLLQTLGTADTVTNTSTPMAFMDPVTETPKAGDIEVWRIFNLTGDNHPIHFHLVNVQILSRTPFDAVTPNFSALGTPVLPDANERGWKETVRINPGEMIEVIMKFDLPVVPFTTPLSPVTGGHDYVWHCHILEHEEHDMMRPLAVM